MKMKKRVSIFLAIAIMAFSFSHDVSSLLNNDGGGLQDSPWPMFCHDVKHTGRSPYDTSMNNGGEKIFMISDFVST